jgi:hypothetical protein
MLFPAAGSSARRAASGGFYLARVGSTCLCNVVRAGVFPQIMLKSYQRSVCVNLSSELEFTLKQGADTRLFVQADFGTCTNTKFHT